MEFISSLDFVRADIWPQATAPTRICPPLPLIAPQGARSQTTFCHVLSVHVRHLTRQVWADGAIPLSGVPTSLVTPSTPTFDDGISPRAYAGGIGTGASAVSPTARGRGTRKGKYQVKDSFNRLRGWINGGFSSSNSRNDAGSRSPTQRARVTPKGSGRGSGEGRGFADRVIAGGDKANENARSSVLGGRSSVGGSSRVGKGRSQVPHNAADRAARAEARAAERKALEASAATREVGGTGSSVGGGKRSSTRSVALANSNNHHHAGKMPHKGGSPRANGSGPPRAPGGSPRAVRTNESQSSSSSSTNIIAPSLPPPPPPMTSVGKTTCKGNVNNSCGPPGSATSGRVNPGLSFTASSPRIPSQDDFDGWMTSTTGSPQLPQACPHGHHRPSPSPRNRVGMLSGEGSTSTPRKCQMPASATAATAAAAVAVSPASRRMAIGALTPGGSNGVATAVPSRARTVKAAKSLGATVPPLSAASRAAASRGAGMGSGGNKASPRAGESKGKPTRGGSGSSGSKQDRERAVEESAPTTKSSSGNVNNGNSERTIEPSPGPMLTFNDTSSAKSGKMTLRNSSKKR